jgi:SAM-dependent methyltransferase
VDISSIFEKQVSMKKVFADGRENYYLPLPKVKKIDKWIRENYSIDCYINFETFFGARGKGTTHQERLKVEKLIKKYIGYFETDKVDSKAKVGLELTNIYASDPWRAWWHSTRRAWLLDSLSFCSAIISDISKKKDSLEVIDVGCNVGIHSNFLAQNHRIELTGIDNSEVAIDTAQKFDIFEEDGELVGQQYQSDTGPMDILAIKKDKTQLLVVELKKGRASDAVVGQVLRYMGYVKQELAEPNQSVKGVIIALDDDTRIRRALAMTPDISFYRYEVSFKLTKAS